jgi:hypothetical protein
MRRAASTSVSPVCALSVPVAIWPTLSSGNSAREALCGARRVLFASGRWRSVGLVMRDREQPTRLAEHDRSGDAPAQRRLDPLPSGGDRPRSLRRRAARRSGGWSATARPPPGDPRLDRRSIGVAGRGRRRVPSLSSVLRSQLPRPKASWRVGRLRAPWRRVGDRRCSGVEPITIADNIWLGVRRHRLSRSGHGRGRGHRGGRGGRSEPARSRHRAHTARSGVIHARDCREPRGRIRA